MHNEQEDGKMADIAPVARVQVRDEVTPKKEDARWYTIHTYAGYENAVERNLKQRIQPPRDRGNFCEQPTTSNSNALSCIFYSATTARAEQSVDKE